MTQPPRIRRPRRALSPELAREIRWTNAALLVGSVLYWTAIAGVIARLLAVW